MIDVVINMEKRQKNVSEHLKDKINIWQREIAELGLIKGEGEVIQCIQLLKSHPDSQLESTLLSLLAQSRTYRLNEVDELSLSWIKRAKELDPENDAVHQFNSKIIFSSLKSLPAILDFPFIREADNRTTKRKLAEEYINRCKMFLEEYIEGMNKVNEFLQNHSNSLSQEAKEWMTTFEQMEVHVTKLLKASEEYYASISGVFHTSVHLDEIKEALDEIGQLQEMFKEENNEQGRQERSNSLLELEQMIGLKQVKERMYRHYHYIQYQKKRKELGFTMKDEVSLNMVLTGNPGTGKTTLARMLAKIYYELGVLPKQEVVEVDRSHLVGSFIGQTEENVKNAIKRSLGGVLFIDEAYSLKRVGQTANDYGQTAIDSLVSAITGGEYAGKFAIILAGYPEEMRQFLWSNPGLRSRFPESNHIHLPDYSSEELLEIARKVALDNDYIIAEEALNALETRIEKERVDESFGNARTVKSIILDSIFQKGATTEIENVDSFDLTLLEKKDLTISQNEPGYLSPEELLNELVGLNSLKDEFRKIQHFVQIQQVRKEKGLKSVPIQLHSVFSGNPGTGKTTVAKIYASLLKESGLLKRGHLVVTSRADLVAGYVGQTAMKTKKKIRGALGGVLFIDEAYSLLSSSSSDFGKEAVDTLVDEMTKHDENLVVVLAGYSNEIEALLKSNPGLKSRFKKFLHFPNYTPDQIVEIILKRVKQYDYTIMPIGISSLKEYIQNHPISGNGRFAENLVDELLQIQAARIMEQADLDEEEFSVINEKDVEEVLSSVSSQRS
jgi:SpoVK/Ycf46/Vps4 family AAA+-type ATPase